MEVDQHNLHGRTVEHKRTKVKRIIFVLDDNAIPSGKGILLGYSPSTHILYDTYLTNIEFYNLLN